MFGAAQRTRTPAVRIKSPVPGQSGAGALAGRDLNPRIRQVPSTSWVAASGMQRCVEPPRPRGRALAFRVRSRAGGVHSREESGGLDPQRFLAQPGSSRRPPGRVHFPRRMAQELNLLRTRAPIARFQRGALPIGQLSCVRTAPGTRTLIIHGLSVAPLTNWARAVWSGWPGLNRRPRRWRRRALPAELHPHGATYPHLGLVPPAIGLRERRASDWPRTSCLPLTRRTLFPVSYRGTAAGQGFEPRLTGSGPAVLPVRRSGTGTGAPPGT